MPSLKIPKDRIGVLIGKDGQTKREIEEETGIVLDIDSDTGEVDIDTEEVEDPLVKMKIKDVIKAIGRGFNPDKAMFLLEDGVYFDLLDIRNYVGKSSKAVKRMRGRVIGKNGRTRELIEELSESYVSIYGNTIGIIGRLTEHKIARKAVEMILNGSTHSAVYNYLESMRVEIKKEKLDWIKS